MTRPVNMTKPSVDVSEVGELYVGVGWSTSGGGKKGLMGRLKRKQGTDLDAGAVLFTEEQVAIRLCNYDLLDSFEDGSMVHSGDNTTGRGSGDDEFITARLSRLPSQVHHVVYYVAAYKEGVSFRTVTGVTCNVRDAQTNREIARYFPPVDAAQTAVVLAHAYRTDRGVTTGGPGWAVREVGVLGSARDQTGLVNLARAHLALPA